MKCGMNCGRDAAFYDEETGIAVCETCWKVIDVVAVHCISDYLGRILERELKVKIKSPFKFKALKKNVNDGGIFPTFGG
jgi:hypothetical protein